MIRDKKHFSLGLVLLISFFAVLFWIFTPTFGDGQNGLQFADDMFNKLSKGSSYFIPKVAEKNEKANGTNFDVAVKVDKPEVAESAAMLLTHAGAEVVVNGLELSIKGDLGKVLTSAIEDADAMFHNDGAKVVEKYGYSDGDAILAKFRGEQTADSHAKGEKILASSWWQVLSKMDKRLQLDKKTGEAKMVSDVLKKAVEPGYNYYGIEAKSVSENAVVMTGILVFYVFYTLWFGFAVFYIFEGLGLAMTKGAKAEH
ncbi:MAG: hypothetical protein IBX64_02230 [Actinobacteria bacterium]|nr:hypothetical protein [Actinomycetota bacterium]